MPQCPLDAPNPWISKIFKLSSELDFVDNDHEMSWIFHFHVFDFFVDTIKLLLIKL